MGSSRGGRSDAPQRFTERLENWRSGGTVPLFDASAETKAAWRTWFDSSFDHLIVLHRAVFYGRSNMPMGVGPGASVGDLQRELATANSRIDELVSNSLWCSFILLLIYLFICLHISLVCTDGRFRGDD